MGLIMTDAIKLAQHILTLKNDEVPAQITGKQLKEICQELFDVMHEVDEYAEANAEMKRILDEQEHTFAVLKEKYEKEIEKEMSDYTNLESFYYPLKEKYCQLKERYRWRKQSEEPMPWHDDTLVETASFIDDGLLPRFYGMRVITSKYAVGKCASIDYWRPYYDPEDQAKEGELFNEPRNYKTSKTVSKNITPKK